MKFTLKIMGTASAMPISDRNPSAQVLCAEGRFFLIDCGEGTQQQLRRAGVSFLKIEAVFITHIHGDHMFGLFGLLGSMALYGRTADLYVYGPQALGSVLKFYESFFGEGMGYKLVFAAVKCREPETVHSSKHLTVTAFPLAHKIECYGYRFDGIASERHPVPPSYAYCSDTEPMPRLAGWLSGVDTLYHEATYPAGLADKAACHHHSTTLDAARCALDAGVRRLLIGHYSSRVKDLDAFVQECRQIFPDTVAARDGDVFEI